MAKGYTDTEIVRAVETSRSMAGVLRKLQLAPAGGNYKTIQTKIELLDLNTCHFTGKGWRKGKHYGPKQPVEAYLFLGSSIKSYILKKRLMNEGLKDKKCEDCGLEQWLAGPIPLELEHVNGISNDNKFENLKILCPNCHALTPTYRGKNIGRRGEIGKHASLKKRYRKV